MESKKQCNGMMWAAVAAGVGVGVGLLISIPLMRRGVKVRPGKFKFSAADQPARFASQKASNDKRALDITSVYRREELKGKRVLVTGSTRGLGLALVKELKQAGAIVYATCRKPSDALLAVGVSKVIEGIDVMRDEDMKALVRGVDVPLDVLINNAGYFKSERESVLKGTMDFADEVKTIDICAVGPLRVTDALFRGGKLSKGAKVAMITSQGGSIAWRDVQCPQGGDYGHHMSKAAANMGAKLLANELRDEITVAILHPGFNKTDMTRKYEQIWEIEGAVDPSIGAMRVLHEINIIKPEQTGRFINCEDGLDIPW